MKSVLFALLAAIKKFHPTDLVAGLAPWLAPVPTAFLIYRAGVRHLEWPEWVAISAGVIVESIGLSAVNVWLLLREYNLDKRQTDPEAPTGLAKALVALYLVVAIALTVLMDIYSDLAIYAPGIWPLFSLAGAGILALRADHRRRLDKISAEKAERRAMREAQKAAQIPFVQPVQDFQPTPAVDAYALERAQKREDILCRLLDIYTQDPHIGASEAAKRLNVHRNSIYNYTNELVQNGRLHKNGHGWEVKS